MLAITSLLFFNSCKKEKTDNPDGGNTTDTIGTVYAAGYRTSSNSKKVALYWRGSNPVYLTDSTNNAEATGITLTGTDLYACGSESNGTKQVAKYWKNGIATNLSSATNNAAATSIVVKGTDVYVAGYETNAANISIAKYWKNGVAVNLTDGLDGLAILPTVMVAGALGIFAYVAGHLYFSRYLGVPYVSGAGELMVFCAAMAGAGLGFLWFNAYPAEVFMGDVGALALGAALGIVAVIVRQEVILFIMGGVFVVETFSVAAQVLYFKYTKKKFGVGRRIFLMAPLHHHYEEKGWKETQVVVRFWIISMMLVLIGLASLKLR